MLVVIAAMVAGRGVAAGLCRTLTWGERLVFGLFAAIVDLVILVVILWVALSFQGFPFTLQNALAAATGEFLPKEEVGPAILMAVGIGSSITLVLSTLLVGLGSRKMIAVPGQKSAAKQD